MLNKIKLWIKGAIADQAERRPIITAGAFATGGFVAGLVVRGWFA